MVSGTSVPMGSTASEASALGAEAEANALAGINAPDKGFSWGDFASSVGKGLVTGFSAAGPLGAALGGIAGAALSAGNQGAFDGVGHGQAPGEGPVGVSGPDGGPGLGGGPGNIRDDIQQPVMTPAPNPAEKKPDSTEPGGGDSLVVIGDDPQSVHPGGTEEMARAEAMRKRLRERMGYWSTRRTEGGAGALDVFTPGLFKVRKGATCV
jgi:hypothetical protein